MHDINVIGLFCEDIREEASGMVSIMGILPDTVRVRSVPSTIPKMGLYVRIHVRKPITLKTVTIRLISPKGDEIYRTTIDDQTLLSVNSQIQDRELPVAGLVSKAVASPFPLRELGYFTAVADIDGEEHICAILNVQLTPDGNVTRIKNDTPSA